MDSDNRSFKCVRLLITATLSAALLVLFTGCPATKPAGDGSRSLDHPVWVGGVSYPSDTEAVTLTRMDDNDLAALAELKQLHTLDVTALALSADDVDAIRSRLGSGVDVVWSVPMSGGKLPSNIDKLSLSGAISEDDAHAVRFFTALNQFTASDTVIDDALLTAVSYASQNNPDAEIFCSASVYGVPLDSSTVLLDLNDIYIRSLDPLCKALELFPKLRTVEMCGCGLSNELMQGLREEYPQVSFVWTVSFLTYTVRTDIQVFSTLAADNRRPGNSSNLAPLFRYCTELRALDLGHMAINDISEIRNLKHLHTLILADNYISDISPLADLKELVYLELFFNSIKDVSPLLELPNLLDLNLCYNRHLTNPTVLTGCKKLERLYISNCGLTRDQIASLREGIPENCIFNYTCSNAVWHNGWRSEENVRNTKIREAFRNWRMVESYPSWDNIIYKNT